MTTLSKWNMSGSYFESCNWEVACPWIFLSPPNTDDGECRALLSWSIENGDFAGTSLDGIKVAMAVNTPGPMTEGNWKVALYIDENASEEQNGAIQQIFAGQAGGIFEVLAGFVGEIIGVTSASIDYTSKGKNRAVKIGNVAEVAIQAIEGFNGEDTLISGAPLDAAPGEPFVVAKSETHKYEDHGLKWNIPGKNGYYSDFNYAV